MLKELCTIREICLHQAFACISEEEIVEVECVGIALYGCEMLSTVGKADGSNVEVFEVWCYGKMSRIK